MITEQQIDQLIGSTAVDSAARAPAKPPKPTATTSSQSGMANVFTRED